MTRLLVEGGCWGDHGHAQRLDNRHLKTAANLIVWRRSLPHSGRWPPVAQMMRDLQGVGYGLTVLVMVRERMAMARSQLLRGHVASLAQAYGNIKTAYTMIFEAILMITVDDWTLIPFGTLALDGKAFLPGLFEGWGLQAPHTVVRDENLKHYQAVNYGS